MVTSLLPDPRSAADVLRGRLELNTALTPCEVWSDGCPSWALVCGSLGLAVTSLWELSSVWTTAAQTWFPTATLRSGPRRLLWRRKTLRILLADWTLLPPADHQWWQTTKTEFILFSGKPRRGSPPAGWFSWARSISHVDCGGVTDGSWFIGVYTRRPFESSPVIPERSRRPLLGILNTTTPGVPLRAPPGSSVTVSKVVYLRPHLISPWGLLPVRESTRPPSVASPGIALHTRTGFVRRPFTGAELGGAWDFPIRWIDLVGSDLLRSEFSVYKKRAPCKVLSLIGGALLSALRQDDLVVSTFLQPAVPGGQSLKRPPKESRERPAEAKRQKELVSESIPATSDETMEPTIDDFIPLCEENEEEHKKSATGEKSKADEALAAVATWNDNLVKGRKERGWHAIPTENLAKALDGFRTFGLW
jgi:hypothetical protein